MNWFNIKLISLKISSTETIPELFLLVRILFAACTTSLPERQSSSKCTEKP